MLVIGLTGGLAAGKSTAAGFFAAAGVAVFDADACVHRLYLGEAAPAVAAVFPDAVRDGRVDRSALGNIVASDPAALGQLERIVHPLVRNEEARFLTRLRAAGARAVLLDVPLLLETESAASADIVIAVLAPIELRRARAARRGMTADRFAALSARQIDDAGRLRRSHFGVDSGGEVEGTRRAVAAILRALAPRLGGGGARPN